MNELSANSNFHHYRIIEKIGQGGMSIVYKAYDNRLNRIVALKIMISSKNPQTLVHEASLMARIDHPNIIKIYDIGSTPCFYFSMEYITGQTLYQWIMQNGDATTQDYLDVLIQIANAVEEIHKSNIVHRDIKPSNILITPDKTVKLMDFGVAKISKKSEIKTKNQLTPVGSPGYMAPEQISGNFSHKSDIYGIGATLYHLICGRPPFYGGQSVNIMFEVLTKDPPPPHRLNPYISKELEAICLKCMQKLPEKRYASVRQLIRDLRSMQQGQTIIAKKYTRLETMKKFLIHYKLVVFTSTLAFIFIVFFIISQYQQTKSQDKLIFLLKEEKKKTEDLLMELKVEKQQTAELMEASLESLEYIFLNHQLVQQDKSFMAPVRNTFVKLEKEAETSSQIKESNPAYNRLYSIAFGLSSDNDDIENALKVADETIAKNPGNSNVYTLKGNLLNEVKRYKDAIPIFQKAIGINRHNIAAYIGLGNAYKNTQSLNQALAIYNEALLLDENNADVHYNRATLLSKMDDIKNAILSYSNAIHINSLHFMAHNNRGLLLQKIGDHVKALDDFNKAIAIKPGFWESLANRGNTYLFMKEYHAAISDYSLAIEINPNVSALYERRGHTYEQVDNFSNALEDYLFLLEKNPEVAVLYYRVGCIYKEMKKYEKALTNVNTFLEKENTSADGYFLRAQIYHETNYISFALRDYMNAVKHKHPNSQEIKKIIQNLRK